MSVHKTRLLTAGSPIKWEQPVRFRQMTTRKYLLLDDDFQPSITDDGMDPKTVFRIHSLSQVGWKPDLKSKISE